MQILTAIVILGTLVALVFGGISWAFQSVWNAVLPAVFGWSVITFWQAVGIIFLLGFIGGVVRHNSK